MRQKPCSGLTRLWITTLRVWALALGVLSEGQINSNGVRYIDEVFADVEVTSGVAYGNNITVIPALQGFPPGPEDLLCDIYEPAGDTETDRPLILYFHTGNFLPQYVNGSAVGTRTDSCAVAIVYRVCQERICGCEL